MSTADRLGTPFNFPALPEDDAEAAKALRPKKIWEQEVRDKEGRRRFHGAFTGGFSAGYYNTVGTKEGWTPKTFTSSRETRAQAMPMKPEDFMDEDDDPMMGKQLRARAEYDTFGSRARAEDLKHANAVAGIFGEDAAGGTAAAADGRRRPVIPGPVPDDLVVPSSNPVGKQLLAAMGWREGQGIGPRAARKPRGDGPRKGVKAIKDKAARVAAAAYNEEDEASGVGGLVLLPSKTKKARLKPKPKPKAAPEVEPPADDEDPYAKGLLFAPTNTDIFQVAVKQNMFGLGFDPHKDASEFRGHQHLRVLDMDRGTGWLVNRRPKKEVVTVGEALATGRAGGGFGSGVLEADDDDEIYGVSSMADFHTTLDGPEDEGVAGRLEDGPGVGGLLHDDPAAAAPASDAPRAVCSDGMPVPEGFVLASGRAAAGFVGEVPPMPPRPPPGWRPVHTFSPDEDKDIAGLLGLSAAARSSSGAGRGLNMNSQTRAVLLGERPAVGAPSSGRHAGPAAPPTPPPPTPAKPPVLAGLDAAFQSRFSSSSELSSTAAPPSAPRGGLMTKEQFAAAHGRSTAPAPAPPPAPSVERPPERSVVDWAPDRLLCKRFNVRDPWAGRAPPPPLSSGRNKHSMITGKGNVMESLFGGDTRQQQQPPTPAAPPSKPPLRIPQFAAAAALPPGAMPPPPARLPDKAPVEAAPPEQQRPSIDFFKSIFDASDSEDDD